MTAFLPIPELPNEWTIAGVLAFVAAVAICLALAAWCRGCFGRGNPRDLVPQERSLDELNYFAHELSSDLFHGLMHGTVRFGRRNGDHIASLVASAFVSRHGQGIPAFTVEQAGFIRTEATAHLLRLLGGEMSGPRGDRVVELLVRLGIDPRSVSEDREGAPR